MNASVFAAESLEDNRRGALSAGQLSGLQGQLARKHRGLTGRIGRPRAATWSMDADGRLHSDLLGAPIVADASVAGDGRAISLRRRDVP